MVFRRPSPINVSQLFALILWTLGVGLSSQARAVPLPNAEADFDAYYLAVLDDPDGALHWATQELAKISPEQQPVLWTRLLTTRLLAGAFGGNRERMSMGVEVNQAYALSQKHGLLREEFELTNIKAEIEDRNSSKEIYLPLMKAMESRMLGSQDFRLHAVYYRTLSSAMRILQDSRLSLDYGRKALQAFSSPEQQNHTLFFEIKNNIATQFMDQNDFKKAEVLLREVSDYCERENIRHFGSLVTYNLAHLYQTEHFPSEFLPKSAEYYMKSIRMAEAIHHDIDVAFGYRGLGKVQTQLKKFKEAHESLDKAQGLFEKYQHGAVWTVWMGQGLLLVQEKRFKESVGILEKVMDGFKDQQDEVPLPVIKALGEAWLQLGDDHKASLYLKKHSEGLEKLFKANKEQELTRLQVQLGLTVEEQKNILLTRENEIQAERIQEGERRRKLYIGFVGLSLLALVLMGVAVGKARQVRASREKMKLVLDHIKEGILTLSNGLKVETSFSPYIKTILGLTQEKEDAFQILLERADLSPDSRDSIRQILNASLNDDIIAWEANSSALPHEVTLDQGEKVISLSWQPIDQNGILAKVLLVLRDVTESKRLAEAVKEGQQRTDRLGVKLTEIISSKSSKVRHLVEPAAQELPAQLERIPQDLNLVLRWIHTLKGSARTLGLQSLADSCHHAETELKAYEKPRQTRFGFVYAAALKRDLEEYSSVLERISSANTISGSSGLGDLLDDQMRVMKPQLEKAGITLLGYRLEDRFLQWTPQILRDIAPIIVHGMNNAMDHGFLLPHKQGREIPSAFFHISVLKRQGQLVLSLRDYGAGLDLARIQQIADLQGFKPEKGGTLTDVLFMDGVSTATELSMTSGRGVGLAAIKQICEEHHGHVQLQAPAEGQGTELEVIWPIVA